MSKNIQNEKNIQITQELRKAGKAGRTALSAEERAVRSAAIVKKLISSDEFKNAEVIMIYKALGAEVDLQTLENAAKSCGKHLLYPLCISKTEMIPLEPEDCDAWICGSYGIKEPLREKSAEYAPGEIDLVICPCTAFDEKCNRIGMGGGYYDRFLPKCQNAHIAAVAFEAQKTACIPAMPWDHAMEKVYTETAVYEQAEVI